MDCEKIIDDILEFMEEEIAREKQNLAEAKKYGGINCVAAGMSDGAIEAYQNILDIIAGKNNNGYKNEDGN